MVGICTKSEALFILINSVECLLFIGAGDVGTLCLIAKSAKPKEISSFGDFHADHRPRSFDLCILLASKRVVRRLPRNQGKWLHWLDHLIKRHEHNCFLAAATLRGAYIQPRKMFAIIGILAGLTAVARAQDFLYLKFNASQSAPNNGYDMWREAERHPNVTHDVSFDRWNQTEDGKDWSWSIGITDVYRPNLTVRDANELQETHNISNMSVALTTYSFSWPGGGSLNAAAADGYPGGQTSRNADFGPSCLYMVFADFPQNVSDALDSSSASCASAIGDSCVQTIMNGFSGVDCDSGNFPSFDVSNGTACSGSFGAASSGLTVNAYRKWPSDCGLTLVY